MFVSIPVPYAEALALPAVAHFQIASYDEDYHLVPAYRGTTVGVHTVFYDVQLSFPPLGQVRGDIVVPTPNHHGQGQLSAFMLSDWISDDISDLLPNYKIERTGNQGSSLSNTCVADTGGLSRELNTPVRQTWKHTMRCGPMVFELWYQLFTGQDLVEWQLFAVFSDPSSSTVELTVDAISVSFGEMVVVDDKTPLGIDDPAPIGSGRWAFQLISSPTVLSDAQGLPIVKGSLLCLPDNTHWTQVLAASRSDADLTDRIKPLLARLTSQPPIVTRNWTGGWLAFQSTVPANEASDALELEQIFQSQWAMMQSKQPLFAQRKRGLLKRTGATGAQPDFGIEKGAQLTLGDPRAALTWHYHTQEPLRPMHYRDEAGAPIDPEAGSGDPSTRWVTWSQQTHYHCGVSTDRLGKPCPKQPTNAHGWTGKDDQHKSSNSLAATVAAFDWPAHRALIRDEVVVGLANVRFLSGQSPGAARAIGRRMLADTNAFLLTGVEKTWARLVVWHGTNALEKSLRGPPIGIGGASMHVQETKTDARLLLDNLGNPVECVVVWQHGLELIGLTAAWETHLYRQRIGLPTVPGTADLADLISGIATTLVRHAFARGPGGTWQTWLTIAWNGGRPVAPAIVAGTDDVAGVIMGRVTQHNGWWDWIFPGLFYLGVWDHGISLPSDVQERLTELAVKWETEVLPSASISRREWYPYPSSGRRSTSSALESPSLPHTSTTLRSRLAPNLQTKSKSNQYRPSADGNDAESHGDGTGDGQATITTVVIIFAVSVTILFLVAVVVWYARRRADVASVTEGDGQGVEEGNGTLARSLRAKTIPAIGFDYTTGVIEHPVDHMYTTIGMKTTGVADLSPQLYEEPVDLINRSDSYGEALSIDCSNIENDSDLAQSASLRLASVRRTNPAYVLSFAEITKAVNSAGAEVVLHGDNVC